jgi:hypothetical protein
MARGWPLGNTIGDAMGLFADKEVRVSVLGPEVITHLESLEDHEHVHSTRHVTDRAGSGVYAGALELLILDFRLQTKKGTCNLQSAI